MEKKQEPEPVKIKTQEIELTKIDVTKYIGKKAFVESVNTYKGQFGYYLKMETTTLDEVQFGKETKEIKASRLFSLFEDKNGKVGWGKDTALGLFLKAKRISTPEEMKGKEVIVQITEDGKYLTFI